MSASLPLAVSLPLLGALATTLAPRRARTLGLIAALASSAVVAWLVVAVWTQGALRVDLGGWSAPLGIGLEAGGANTLLLAMTALVALAISVHAGDYFRDRIQLGHFWPLWLLLWAALNALLLAADLFNIYVGLELLGLAGAALAALGGSRAALSASLRYLLVGLLGSMTYLLGVALIYTAYGQLDLGLLATQLTAGAAEATALALLTLGLAFKAALFPLHFWLPPTHANAPAPVSAALSALVGKVAAWLILLLWLGPFATVTAPAGATLLGLLGACGVVWGSWRALRAERLKLLAAHSTVAQIGYLFIFVPLLQGLAPGSERTTLIGALLLMALTHGFAKAAFFLAAGQVQQHAGHDRISDLGGTAQRLPATTFTLGLAGVALIGLPPSGSFIGKWLLLEAAIAQGQWWWIAPLLAGTLLAAAYVFRVLARAFNLEPTPQRFVNQGRAELPGLVLAVIAVVGLGLAAGGLWGLLEAVEVER
ncbi:complex I subunit 5 family protein [Marichromatium bheemlicum]|uniref:Oxidoreductase n=1 Tax=Marichromatium bheemlicum TaxID=365339 RepID=A0ABX1I5B8_9GAMM|nr:proton-conducting transporter membrane subunit [Marichromatium bheemlicum]NKN32765.1 oxidoreductase [Marichromatium bheemlicum]